MSDDDECYDPRCGCGHFRSEHDGGAIKSDRTGATLIEAGYCSGAYHSLHHDYERQQVEVSCPCSKFHLPDPDFHPGFIEVSHR
jgi:hypothetical protein